MKAPCMETLQEFGEAVIRIRTAVDQLEIRGSQNAALVLFCNKTCNELVEAVNEALKTAPPGDVDLTVELKVEDEQPEEEE